MVWIALPTVYPRQVPPEVPAPPTTRTVDFVDRLAAFGNTTAVVTSNRRLTYAQLASRVDDLAERLGHTRRLVLLEARNDLDSLVGYLACLSGAHPVLLAPAGIAATTWLTSAYDPDVVLSGGEVCERREGTAHDLHPDLALLLSTSGSTGSPKLVRLSQENLQSNAEAIASYLGIRPGDRAATTLPISYCYGLSVVNSHLLRGAGLLLTDLSVVDACFWSFFRAEGGTTFAGVPHTFELLDRFGFSELDLPALRYVTQAGGRLAPERVRQLAELGLRQGWDLFVMYGQTEATARMAYLPPDLARTDPTAIGIPVPGGAMSLRPVEPGEHPDPDVGEIVYSGPNVMLGYAESPHDLSLGRVLHHLATGDLARVTTGGLYEVVGRRSRFLKVVGLRVSLTQVEDLLAGLALTVCCTGEDERLVIAVEGDHDLALVRKLVAAELRLPSASVQVLGVVRLPLTTSGKPDTAAVAALAREQWAAQTRATATARVGARGDAAGTATLEDLRRLYAERLEVPHVREDDSFVSLGGDSLSYVTVSLELERLLGHLPRSWHTTPVRELVPAAPLRRRLGRAVETSVALRALAIVLIVGTHADLFALEGSAHVLLAVAGFNFARFQLTDDPRAERLRHQARSIGRVVLPSVAWIGGAYLLTDTYRLHNVFLLNTLVGSRRWNTEWQPWFVEVLVLTLLAMAALLAVPRVDRLERRFPVGFAATVVGIGTFWRLNPDDLDLLHTKPTLWLFGLGWAAARVTSVRGRLVVTATAVLAVPGFFDDPLRDGIILAGILLLVWVPAVRLPVLLSRLAGVLASASLYVYVSHWQVYPDLERVSPLLAVVASLVVGVAYWQLVTRLTRASSVHLRLPQRLRLPALAARARRGV